MLLALAGLTACGSVPRGGNRELACMARAMYFESNRSSDEGMLAVGTVVMNRVESDQFPNTVCGVVGQKNQFAPGVLSKPMKEGKSMERAMRMAAQVLGGKRHRGVGRDALFFHTAGHNFPYTNMHYRVIAGGNAFYVKRKARPGQRNTTQREVAMRSGRPDVQLASVGVVAQPRAVRRVRAAPPPPIYPAAYPAATAFAEPPTVPPAVGGSIEDLILLNGGG